MKVSILFIITAIFLGIIDLFAHIHSLKNNDEECKIGGDIVGILSLIFLIGGILLNILYGV